MIILIDRGRIIFNRRFGWINICSINNFIGIYVNGSCPIKEKIIYITYNRLVRWIVNHFTHFP